MCCDLKQNVFWPYRWRQNGMCAEGNGNVWSRCTAENSNWDVSQCFYTSSDHFIFEFQCHVVTGPGIWGKKFIETVSTCKEKGNSYVKRVNMVWKMWKCKILHITFFARAAQPPFFEPSDPQRASKTGANASWSKDPPFGPKKKKVKGLLSHHHPHLLFEKYQNMAFWWRRLPQISGIINFLACEKCKIYCTKVMIKNC